MRQIGTLPDAFQARALADHLLTLRIETRIEQQPEGYAFWVCDEDRVAEARRELDAFQKNPRDARYVEAGRAAAAIRRQEDEVEAEYARQQTELREVMAEPRKQGKQSFTFALIAASIVIAVLTRFGSEKKNHVLQMLFIAPFTVLQDDGEKVRYIPPDGLSSVAAGEVWRLVTPALIHFDVVHLLFNVIMLLQLGGAFEQRRGTWRYIVFIFATAALSNLAQYYLGWLSQASTWQTDHRPNPLFGGLSGVNYALFGYVWMKSRYQPELGFVVTQSLVVIMVVWFLLCFTGEVGRIANVAHATGLALGVLIGAAPTLWRGLRVPRNDKQKPDSPIVREEQT